MALSALEVRGPFKGPSGYEHHVREFVRELDRQGVAVQLVDYPLWGPAKLPPHSRDPWFESLDRPIGARVVLHFLMPHQVVPDPKRSTSTTPCSRRPGSRPPGSPASGATTWWSCRPSPRGAPPAHRGARGEGRGQPGRPGSRSLAGRDRRLPRAGQQAREEAEP